MSVADDFLLTESLQPGEFFKKELIHGEFYFSDEIFPNVHRYLPYCILYPAVVPIRNTNGTTSQSVIEFLEGTGPNMFDYVFDKERAAGGFTCNMAGTWTYMYARFFLKEPKSIVALKLAFG